jgi:TRAP-type C4-dicarboxylate transport system permease large subunit
LPEVIRAIWPFLVLIAAPLFLVTCGPAISMTLPDLVND